MNLTVPPSGEVRPRLDAAATALSSAIVGTAPWSVEDVAPAVLRLIDQARALVDREAA